ncbi:Gfo/Idh/MocA family protein [Croceitalea marina]|uniref:Gfo/Idh/MocA family protein n=1 Tax=Croceitalea marina TaxID=1775166 RepID=A0ABW5MTU6_9FLAO
MKRRDFVIGTGAALLSAASYSNIIGANDRLGVALVGAGRRGRWMLKKMLETGIFRPIILCDVWDEQMKRTKDFLKLDNLKETYSIDEVLSNKDVDVVLLASPDHLHKSYAVKIVKAGKHLYLEKPVTLKYQEGYSLKKALNNSSSVCQTGTQQRSGNMYKQIKEDFFESSKMLGNIVFARAVWSDFGWQRRKIESRPEPKNFKWNTFLGESTKIPYQWARYDAWRNYKEYGAGILSDLLTHWVDVAQWMMNDTNPLNAVTTGGIYYLKDGRSNPDTVNSVIQYNKWNFSFECTVLPIKNSQDSVLFQGTKGSLEVFRSGYIYRPHVGNEIVYENSEDLDLAHVYNFIDAIKTGKKPSANIQVGLDAVKPSHLAVSSYWEGKKVMFNEEQTKIIDAN